MRLRRRHIAFLLAGCLLVGGLFWVAGGPTPPPIVKPGRMTSLQPLGDISIPFGRFTLEITEADGQALRLQITYDPGGDVAPSTAFDSAAGTSFIAAGRGTARYHQARGMFRLEESVGALCRDLQVTGLDIERRPETRVVHIDGLLTCPDGPLEVFTSFEDRPETEAVLGYHIRLGADAAERGYNRLYLTGASTKDEAFYGFGAQVATYDFKGRRVPILVTEQGIGRGVEPLSTILNWFYEGAEGSWHSAYAPVPQTLTNKGRGLFAASYATSEFDLRADDRLTLKVHDTQLVGGLVAGRSVLEMISGYTRLIGRQRPLPDWVMDGAILGLQGGSKTVTEKLAVLEAAGAPISALWLQDWVGQRTTSFGKQLWWSWTLDRGHYPDWPAFRRRLAEKDIRVLGYINPFLVDTKPWEQETGRKRRNLFNTARVAGYLVRDRAGAPYLEQNTSFDFAILDLSSPDARHFAISTIRQELIGNGFSGWMADFGEALPMDGVIATDAALPLAHNRYPDEWAEVNFDAIGPHPQRDDFLIFHRSGHYQSPRYATALWLGDQLVTWDEHDGLKSAIVGHLTSGISGHAVTHADVGGYTTITAPVPLLPDYHRSQELLLRWAEFAAFTPIFRTHEGNAPDKNHQAYSDPDTARAVARMASLYACLKPYRQSLNAEVRDFGWPMTRHPLLHWPDEKAYADMTYQQIMMGDAIMLAPVTEPGASSVDITLPADSGNWIHLFTGEIYTGGTHTIDAPIGAPAAFVREQAAFAGDILRCVPKGDVVDRRR